jgi:ribosomal protein L3 glutamine methyltransferase
VRRGELVGAAAARLEAAGVAFGQGTLNAHDEAAWLVLHAIGVAVDDPEALGEAGAAAPMPPAAVAAAMALVERRVNERRPAAYLTCEAWLQGLPFHCDERTIVPRSLLAEVLAEGVFDDTLGAPPARVLDLCTGGGSLAVLAALAWPGAEVHAADLSGPALEVAALNLERHGVAGRVALHTGDGFDALPAALAARGFDLVLCNPPYVPRAAMQTLPPEFRAEPALALDGGAAGGEDGMDFLRAALPKLPAWLAPAGVAAIEIGHEAEAFAAAFPRWPLAWCEAGGLERGVVLLRAEDLMRARP